MELCQDRQRQTPAPNGSHVGHTLALHGTLWHNSVKINQPVLAYKFDASKYKKFKMSHPDLRSYVNALEEIAQLGLPWTANFVGTSCQGVVVNNKAQHQFV